MSRERASGLDIVPTQVLRSQELVNNIAKHVDMSTKLQTVIKYCVVLIVIVHWTACALKLVTEYTLNECNYRGAEYEDGPCLCGNQPVRRVHRQFFTKSFLGDDAAVLARSSGEEPSLRADKELRRENAVVVLLRYVCASDVYVRALLEDSFWSG